VEPLRLVAPPTTQQVRETLYDKSSHVEVVGYSIGRLIQRWRSVVRLGSFTADQASTIEVAIAASGIGGEVRRGAAGLACLESAARSTSDLIP
jgi:hypothetical protein